MSLVAQRGVNKKSPIDRVELDKINDYDLIDSIKHRNLKISLPTVTKQKLMNLLNNSQNHQELVRKMEVDENKESDYLNVDDLQ